MTNVSTCQRCGLPQFDGPYGYVGPVCKCWAAYAPNIEPNRTGRAVPVPPLTESDIRRIVREELARDMEERKAKLRAFVAEVHGADPDPNPAGHTSKE